MEEFLSVNELSKLLHVKAQTIYSWVNKGYIPHVKLCRLVRFKVSEIELWLKERECPVKRRRVAS